MKPSAAPTSISRPLVFCTMVILGLLAPAYAGAAVVIDDFSTDQGPNSVPGTASSTADGGMLGGERDLSLLRSSGAGTVTAQVTGGELTFTAPAATVGELLLTWDGDDDAALTLDPTGISPAADLTQGGTQGGLRIMVEEAEAGTHLVVTVYEDATHVSRAGRVLPTITSGQIVIVNFSELVPAPGALGPADLTSVGAITLRLGGSNSATPPTARISHFETAPPAVAALKVDRTTGEQTIPPGLINPGDQIRYRITIDNPGGGAEDVDLADMLESNLGLVGGSVRTTPVARRDQYRTVTDTVLDSAVALLPDLLANDSDFDGNALVAVTATGQATSQGGSVDIDADGDFVYTPPLGFQGVDSFTYTLQATAGDPTVNASGGPIGPIGSTAYVVIDRVPPVVTAGGTLAYTENDPPTAIDTTITVTDTDSANLAGATAEISANYVMGEDVLSFTNTVNITGVFVPGTGVLTLTGSDTVANYQTALRNVRYHNTSESPSTLARTVTWTATDGVETSAPATSTITVASVNDPPTVTTSMGAASFTEDGGPVVVDGALTVTDPDDTNLESATVSLASAPNGAMETLAVPSPGTNCPGLAVTPGNPLTISGSALVATYQTCLRNVTYNNTSQDPNTTDRTVNFQVHDGTDPSNTAGKTVTVTAVNDPPVAGDDAWDTIGNTQLVVDLPALALPHVRDTTPSGFGVRDNDSDPAEGDNHAVSAIVGCADLTPPFGDSPVCMTVNGGSVLMNANGTFVFSPKNGDGAASDSFQYTLTDDGTPAPASDNGTVTITRFERVWYVDNDSTAGGLGRSHDPFDTLAEAQTASVANDWIFVHFGDGLATGQSAGIALKAGQHLVGEHHGLSIQVNLNGNGSPANLFAAVPGNRPLIDHSGAGNNAVSATDVIPIEIVGLSLMSVNANAIDLTHAVALPAVPLNSLSIQNNVIRGAGAEGIDVNLNAGTTGTLLLGITGNSWNTGGTHTGNAVDVNRAAGTLHLNFSTNTNILSAATAVNVVGGAAANTFLTGFANNTVHQNTGGSGLVISNATFDTTPGAPYNQVTGGTTVVGASGDGVGGAAMSLALVAGDLAFTDLDLFGAAGLGISGTGALNVGAGTGTRVAVVTNVAVMNATGGPAVDVNNATIDLQLNGMTSSGSPTTGVSLVSVADAISPAFPAVFSAPSGSTIGTATGTDFNLDGGNATVTYNGTINNTAGRSVAVQNRTADTATLTGGITDTGTGILLNANNVASTTNFQGGLSLSTGSSAAFTATSGGTLNVCDESPCNPGATGLLVNTLTTTTGTALNVTSTTIGANNLEFQSISAGTGASGPANGIVLNTTGSSGGLKVKGTGSAGSGGTIQDTTGHGISLTTTFSPSFDRMNIDDTGGSGIKGADVTNVTITNCAISDSATALGTDESNIAFNAQAVGVENNLDGVVTITGNALTNAFYHGVDIFNFNGTISDATISNNTITSTTSTATSKGSAIRLVAFGSATTVGHVIKATFDTNIISNFPGGAGIVASGGNAGGAPGTFGQAGSGTNIIAITNNRIAGSSPANRMGINAIQAVVNGAGEGNFNISNNGTVANPLTNVTGNVIVNSAIGDVTVTSTIANNVIVANHTAGVGGALGISVGADSVLPACTIGGTCDNPDFSIIIDGNSTSATDAMGILARSVNNTGSMTIAVTDNTVAAPLSGFREGIQVHSGSSAGTGDTSVCLKITGNTTAGSGGADGIGLRKQGTNPSVHSYAVDGMVATSSPGVETYVHGLNSSADGSLDGDALGVTLISATSGFSNCTFVF